MTSTAGNGSEAQGSSAREWLEMVIESIPTAAVIVEPSGSFSYVNRRARELYGVDYSGNRMEDHLSKIRALKPDGTPFPFEEMPVAAALQGERTQSVEMLIEHPSGARTPVLVSAAPLRYAPGGIEAAIVLFEDISEQKSREGEATFFASLADELSRASCEADVMAVVGQAIGAHLKTDNVLFAKIDEERGTATVTTSWGTPRIPDLSGVYKLSNYISQEFMGSARAGDAVVIRDTQTDVRTDAAGYQRLKIGAFVTVPFSRDGRWRYLFTVNDARPRDWTDDEVRIIKEVTARAFPRLERAQAEEAQAAELARTRLLQAVAEAAAAHISLEHLARRALAALVEHLDLRMGAMGVVDDETEEVRLIAAVGVGPEILDAIRLAPLDPESPLLLVRAAATNHVVLDADRPRSAERLELLEQIGFEPAKDALRNVAVPIEADGKVLGAFGLAFRTTDEFTPEEIDLLRSVAHVLGQAFKNARLFETQQRLLALMDHNPSLLFLKDAAGRYVYLNSAYRDEFVQSDDWYGKTDFDFWPRESAELFRADDAVVLESDQKKQFVEDSRDTQGQRHVWLTYKFPFTDDHGRRYSGGIAIEATELVETEEALRASEAKVHDLVRYAPTGIYEVAFDPPRFISVNDAMSTLSGYGREELLAMDPFDVLDEESRVLFRERMAATIAGVEVEPEVEYGIIRKNGEHMNVVLNLRVMRDADGIPYGAFVIGHDVTERRRTEDALRQSRRRYRTLYKSANELSQLVDLDAVLNILAESILAAVPHTRVRIGLVERSGLRVTTAHGAPPLHDAMVIPWEAAPSIKNVIDGGVSTVVDYDAAPAAERSQAETYDGHVLLWVPIRRGDETIGLVGVDDPGERRDFDDTEVELVQAIAAQAASAIENARLFASERRSAALNRALSEISADLSRTLDVAVVLPTVLARIAEAIGAAGVSIAMRESGLWHVTDGWGASADLRGTWWDPAAVQSQELAHTSRMPVIVDDVLRSRLANQDVAEEIGYQAFGIYPLLVRGQSIGTISITFAEPQEFDERLTTFMSRVAYVLSSALESARLYEVEHHIAETLQETLVVLPTHVPGVEFARAYESATYQPGWVGGDFVDLFEIGPHAVGVVIGDVSGKGTEAAVTTSLVRNTLRAHAIEGLSPTEVCVKTNNVMFRFTEMEAYVTLFFGVLDTQTGLLRYVGAGHPPAILLGKDGTTRELPITGSAMIGAFDRATCIEQSVTLGKGDRLLLYTDGVTEARSRGGSEFFDVPRLQAAMRQHAGEPTSRLPKTLMDDVITFSEGVLRDDAAILVVEPTRLRKAGHSERKG